jgi:hypothetical protein
MKVTLNVPDKEAHDLRAQASSEGKSVSSLVTELIEYGIKAKNRRTAKENILRMVGQARVDKGVGKVLQQMRSDDDRT